MTRSRLPICPECGEPNPRPRAGGIGQQRSHSAQKDYRCVDTDCGHEFDSWELEHREPKSGLDPTNSEPADALLEADPDDIVTDGGKSRVLESAEGMPGTSAGDAIPPATAHFQEAADRVQAGDPDGARHAARQALQILEAER